MRTQQLPFLPALWKFFLAPFSSPRIPLVPSLCIIGAFLLSALPGCSLYKMVPEREGCKIDTILNVRVVEYLGTQYHSQTPARMAVIPFDVPESFARAGHESLHFGRELARNMQRQLLKGGEIPIVELLDQLTWQGKREEFFHGNFQAIELARNAGYQLVMVGYMDPIVNDKFFSVQTKIIDVTQGITLWYGRTTVHSLQRTSNKWLARFGLTDEQPSRFAFPERVEELTACTVAAIVE